MANSAKREAWVGCIAAALVFSVIAFAFLAPLPQNQGDTQGLSIFAEFGRIDGLVVGSPVRLAGIDIGRVADVALTESQRAKVTLYIVDGGIQIPSDTAAVIETDGIFGEKYVELHPGGEFDSLSSGQNLSYSQDSVVLESLLNQIVARAQASAERAEEEESTP